MLKIIKYAAVQNEPVVINHRPVLELVPECVPQANSAAGQDLLAEAEKVLTDAQQKARECIEKAAAEAEEIKRQAYEAGHQEGYQEGYSEGIRSGKSQAENEMRQEINVAHEKAEKILNRANQKYKESIVEAEQEIIRISLAVAKKILAREIEYNPMVVLPIVKAAIEKVRDQQQVVVRVNPDDFELVTQAKRDLQRILGRENAISIVDDHTIDPGGCIVDTPYGTVDASIDSQFAAIESAILEIMP